MGQQLNILHISDFHLKRHSLSSQDAVASAFREDIAQLSSGIMKPDVVIISGDLVNAADDPDIYGAFNDRMLSDLVNATKCSDRRIFLCPGNHDAHRSAITANTALQRDATSAIQSEEAAGLAYDKGLFTDLADIKFREFNEIERMLSAEQCRFTDGIATLYQVPEADCFVLSLNTALLTSAGLAGANDERQLFVPEECIRAALSKVPEGAPIIAVTHHPLSWLSEQNERQVRQLIERRCCLHLYGHVHDPRPTRITSIDGDLVVSQAGALYAGRNRYNGYGILCHNLSTRGTTAVLRTFFEKRGVFDEATDVAPHGIFHTTHIAKEEWKERTRAIDIDKYRAWLKDGKHAELRESYNTGLVDRPLCDIFVSPPMYAIDVKAVGDIESQAEEVEEPISLSEVIHSPANFVFFGRQEYGKTSLLRQIAYQSLCSVDQLERPRLPIVIAFDDISGAVRRIEKLILGGLHGVNPPFDFEQILVDGLVCLLVDDVDFSDAKRQQVLCGFVNKYPRNRYLFSSSQREGERFSAVPTVNAIVPFRNVVLHHFSRRDMRQLVEKWDSQDRLDRETILNRLAKELANINVPFTAVNGSILLTIYEQQSNFTPINRAVLVERFIEVLLEKRSLTDAVRKTFDFRNKVHLLAHLTEHMARADKYILDYLDVVLIFDRYFSKLGLNQDGKFWVEQFLKARVLVVRPDEQLSFRYRAFLEYFIACRMSDESTFRSWVLTKDRYLSYLNEIQYFAGKIRTDSGLLDLIGERFEELTERILEDETVQSDLKRLETFRLPDPKSKDVLADLESQMDLPPLSPAERDEVLEGEIPRDIEGRQEVFRPQSPDVGSEWTVGLLLYSGVLKNLELVDDEVKRRHLRRILRSWGLFTTASLGVVPLIAKHRKVKINGVMYEVLVPRSFSDAEAARVIYLGLPNAIGTLLLSVLGTEKLERQLLEPELLEATEPKIVELYKNVLILGLRLGNWDRVISKFIPSMSKHRYLAEALAWWLVGTYRVSEPTETLRRLASEAIGSAKGSTDADRKRIKSRQMQKLKRRDLIRSIHFRVQNDSPLGESKVGKLDNPIERVPGK